MKKSEIDLIPWSQALAQAMSENRENFIEKYLQDSLEDNNPKSFHIALGNVARANRGGMDAVAKKSGLGRRTIYRLSKGQGTPTKKTVELVLKALGFGFKVSLVKLKKEKAA